MSVGDPICSICGRYISLHTDNKPCGRFNFKVCPHCGNDLTWSWKEEKVEFKNRPSTVDIIIRRPHLGGSEHDVLFIKRKHDPFQGMWALPGGYLDYDEGSLELAAVREMKEETNINISNLELIGVFSDYTRYPGDDRHNITHVYFANQWDGEPKAGDDAEEIAWRWTFELNLNINTNNSELAFDHAKIIKKFIELKGW